MAPDANGTAIHHLLLILPCYPSPRGMYSLSLSLARRSLALHVHPLAIPEARVGVAMWPDPLLTFLHYFVMSLQTVIMVRVAQK